MTASHEPLEWNMRMGPTTKPTTLTSGERIVFTRDALEQAAASANGKYIPQSIEHLGYLPPIGRIVDVWVQDESDGYAYLFARGAAARAGIARDMALAAYEADGQAADGPREQPAVSLSYEPRNFDLGDREEIEASAPVPIHHHAMHSELPPLVWSLAIGGGGAVFWASKALLESFFSTLGEGLGGRLAEWLVARSSKARDPHRSNLVEARFETESGVKVSAFCPFSPDSGEAVTKLREGLNALGDVAVFCASIDDGAQPSEMKAVAFLWDGARWQLGWWASDDAVFVTPWYRSNMPEPERFLGRPITVGRDALDYFVKPDGAVSIGGLKIETDPEEPAPPPNPDQ